MPKAIQITYGILKNASDEYQNVFLPLMRANAGKFILSGLKRNLAVKKAIRALQKARVSSNVEQISEAETALQKARSISIEKMQYWEEPAVFDERFKTQLVEAIEDNHYHLIDFKHEHFTECLLASLRLGHINMNQMMTAKLMYESLKCFNLGKIPDNPRECFTHYKISDASGPYQPQKDISHWRWKQGVQLRDELQLDTNKPHYYTINLPHHQAVLFLQASIKRESKSEKFIQILKNYLIRTHKGTDGERVEKIKLLEEYVETPSSRKDRLIKIIQEQEPKLKYFLDGRYLKGDNEQTLGLSFPDFELEYDTAMFMANLFAVNCQIPMFCIPSEAQSVSVSEQPLLSFVLPTIDTLNILQIIAHGDEATMPQAIMGGVTTRMIRAFDEIPASRTLSPNTAQKLLSVLYPTATKLQSSARPIE